MQAQSQAMQAIGEKVGGTQGESGAGATGANKSRPKGRHPDKLEQDVDYATFLQCEKS